MLQKLFYMNEYDVIIVPGYVTFKAEDEDIRRNAYIYY